MSLVGTRLGTYDIQELAGRGGMGEVYRARDSKLKRTVALKFLPTEFSQHPDRLQRFQQEAEALAALNHPNIAAIYALDEADNSRFLVLEFVEGETIADRLARGPIPPNEVVTIGLQICSALSAAHDQGIVHRDLKPANVKITPAGQIKLLDFGLAKVLATDPAPRDLSHSPTIAMTSSDRGAIAGTAAYMAPEQARGKPVDKRADLWALGCVLYEMLTAHAVFDGETLTDVLAAVVTRQPDLSRLPADTPAQLRWVIERCLQKDASVRMRDAADAHAILSVPMVGSPVATAAPIAASGRPIWHWAAAVAAAVVLAVAAFAIGANRTGPETTPRLTSFEIPTPGGPLQQALAISPDGSKVVFVAATEPGQNGLWMRALDRQEPTLIAGTNAPRNEFMNQTWSPDGRRLAFMQNRMLKTIAVAGGVAETLAMIETQVGGITWNRDDVILFSSNNHGLRWISASGGMVSEVTTRDAALDETYHDCPVFLPDGHHFLYLAYSDKKRESRAVYIGDLQSNARTRLMASDTCVSYTPGFVVIPNGQSLLARPFDADALKFTGEPVEIVNDVATYSGGEMAAFAVSEQGALVYRKVRQAGASSLVWFDRNGRSTPVAGDAQMPGRGSRRLSGDGTRLVFSASTGGVADDIWTYDLARNVRVRLTSDSDVDHNPVWSGDGTRVLFDSHRGGQGSALYEIDASGATQERVVMDIDGADFIAPTDASRDGRYVVFIRSKTGNPPWSLWAVPLSGDRTPFLYRTSEADYGGARLSPNGRWLAYQTNESGAVQVVVQPFPDPAAGKWQISDAGGSQPEWRADGRELYYEAPSGDLIAVPVTTDGAFTAGRSATLFRLPVVGPGQGLLYGAAADGQRFIVLAPSGDSTPPAITTLLNWPALLRTSP